MSDVRSPTSPLRSRSPRALHASLPGRTYCPGTDT
ncbi:MAG: hypothetical protein ACFWUJ_16440 [Pseudomonas fragi]